MRHSGHWGCAADLVRADDSEADDSRRRFDWMGHFEAKPEYRAVDISMLFGCELTTAAEWISRTAPAGARGIRHHQLVRWIDRHAADCGEARWRFEWATRISVQGHYHRERRQERSQALTRRAEAIEPEG